MIERTNLFVPSTPQLFQKESWWKFSMLNNFISAKLGRVGSQLMRWKWLSSFRFPTVKGNRMFQVHSFLRTMSRTFRLRHGGAQVCHCVQFVWTVQIEWNLCGQNRIMSSVVRGSILSFDSTMIFLLLLFFFLFTLFQDHHEQPFHSLWSLYVYPMKTKIRSEV